MGQPAGHGDRFTTVARTGTVAGARRRRARDADGTPVDLDELPEAVRTLPGYDAALRDLRAVAAGGHPHLVAIREVLDAGPAPVVVREAVDGSWLGAVVPPEGLEDPGLALDLVADVAETLGALHRDGLAHGDVGAGRVRLDRGTARLADAGVAPRLVAQLDRRVERPTPADTVERPTPADTVERPTPADDVHGLAVLAWRLLTGTAPPADVPPDVREHRDDVPDRVAEVLAGALGDDPDARPATVGELARDLGRPRAIAGPRPDEPTGTTRGPTTLQDGGLVEGTRGGDPAASGPGPREHHPWATAVVAVVLLALVVLLATVV